MKKKIWDIKNILILQKRLEHIHLNVKKGNDLTVFKKTVLLCY